MTGQNFPCGGPKLLYLPGRTLHNLAQTQTQPQGPARHEGIKKMGCTHIHEGVLLGRKKYRRMPLAAPWMQLEPLTRSELRPKEIATQTA